MGLKPGWRHTDEGSRDEKSSPIWHLRVCVCDALRTEESSPSAARSASLRSNFPEQRQINVRMFVYAWMRVRVARVNEEATL